jgi:isopentenyldiphosphate isomerase
MAETEEEERFQLVDREGRPCGAASRRECHGNPKLIHAVVHLQVTDGRGRLYLQKRSPRKDLYPGYWDTAVGGHVQAGEAIADALMREAFEELGVRPEGARLLFTYLHGSAVETEYVSTFGWTSAGELRPNPEEIVEGRYYSPQEIEARLGGGYFTPNFEEEYRRLRGSAFLPGAA